MTASEYVRVSIRGEVVRLKIRAGEPVTVWRDGRLIGRGATREAAYSEAVGYLRWNQDRIDQDRRTQETST